MSKKSKTIRESREAQRAHSANIPQRIKDFNKGRIPALLALKYKAMRSSSFSFFRGTCHLFYDDLASSATLKDTTRVWICGDLHLENFGSYKGDNRAVYFDLNDFDEAILAPCTWELVRVLSSIHVAAQTTGFSQNKAQILCESFLKTYSETLMKGKAGSIEKDTVGGIVHKFLLTLKSRNRTAFIRSRTRIKKGKIKLIIDNKKTMAISQAQKTKLIDFVNEWRSPRSDRKFFKVLDAAFRIAGTGSLGVERYVLLVQGNGEPNHYLLDLKTASPSCLAGHIKLKQPVWSNEAERISQIQSRVQAVAPALLTDVKFDGHAFVFKELQPTQDKMSLSLCNGKLKKLEDAITVLATLCGWSHLRAGGRQGSSIADELIEFSKQSAWKKQVLTYSEKYFVKVENDYQSYCKAFDAGFFASGM
jgi:uncharacterized protein (DUF2252 family)